MHTSALTHGDLEALIRPVLPGARVVGCRRAAQIASRNLTLWVALADPDPPVALRFYPPGSTLAAKQRPLHDLLTERGVSVPRCLHADACPLTGGRYMVLEWLEGERLGLVVERLGGSGLAELGLAVGAQLAAIHQVALPIAGFLDDRLQVVEPLRSGLDGLMQYLEAFVLGGQPGARAVPDLAGQIARLASAEGDLLAGWSEPAGLAHGDCHAGNILVRNPGDGWRVAAVLDWDFALSAGPLLDFSSLLAGPPGEHPDLVAALGLAYRRAGGRLPTGWQRSGRLAQGIHRILLAETMRHWSGRDRGGGRGGSPG